MRTPSDTKVSRMQSSVQLMLVFQHTGVSHVALEDSSDMGETGVPRVGASGPPSLQVLSDNRNFVDAG